MMCELIRMENIKYIQKYTGRLPSYLPELSSIAVLILERRCKGMVIARRPHLDQSVPGRMRVELPWR